MRKIISSISIIALLLTSCEWLDENLPAALSEEEVIEGLKTALEIGADSASSSLSVLNGYYGDALVKIPLPQEAESVRNMINGNSTLASISNLVGLDDAFENVIVAVNRAAEDAAREATPIFVDAITDMTISDGWDILNGVVPASSFKNSGDFDSTAATQYLMNQTYNPLTNLYAPKINASLDKTLIGDKSAVDIWRDLTGTYNNFVGRTDVTIALTLSGIDLPSNINDDLGEFSTQKALDGIYYKVGEEEKKIRRNPFEWALDILHRVFGNL
jgi:hypothetical protein